LNEQHANLIDRKEKDHDAEQRNWDTDKKAYVAQHKTDLEAWRVQKTDLENAHTQNLNNRKNILAGREAEF